MADQGVWFKLHCSALDDPDLDNLSAADFGRWAKLGAFVKRHGQAGVIVVTRPARTLCAYFQLGDFDCALDVIKSFPHVRVEERQNGNDPTVTSAVVSFDNWPKYQGDFSTARVRKFREMKRSKRRGEEKRREEKRREKRTPPPPPPLSPPSTEDTWGTPDSLVALYNHATPDRTPAVEKLSEGRRQTCRRALKQNPDRTFWQAVMAEFHRSKWLRGEVGSSDYPARARDLDWLLQRGKDGAENYVKVWEGKYRDGP